jgi:transcriptional regulator with XRE-family HTH domain
MGRRLTKPRPKQGAHLAQLRKAAGLSQAQLAKLIDQPQGNVAFWELSDKPPRSDLLPKLAKVLGVNIQDLIYSDSVKKISSRKTGPISKLRKLFLELEKLPRHQQDKIIDFLSLFIKQHQLSKQAKQSKQS